MTLQQSVSFAVLVLITATASAEVRSDEDALRVTAESQFESLDANNDDQLDETELQKLSAADLSALHAHGLPGSGPVPKPVFVIASIATSLAAVPTPEDEPEKEDPSKSGRDGSTEKGAEAGKTVEQKKVDVGTSLSPNTRISSKRSHFVPELPAEFAARDKNGDGQIALYEWDRKKYSEFAKLDKNGDGFLTPIELLSKEVLKTLYAKTQSRPGATPGSGTPAAAGTTVTTGSGGTPDASGVEKEARDTFAQMDENKDGNIDEADWGRSRRIRPWFESVGIKVSLPMNTDAFVAQFRRAKESTGR
jgi:hypothetical protein